MSENKKLSIGTILALSMTAVLLVGLIVCSFIFSSQKFIISGSIITLVCLLLILVLSNSFDNFSVGKILTISREANENKEKIKSLEKEKSEILLKLINLNLQSQSSSTNINIGQQDNKNDITVENLNSEEKAQKAKEIEEDHEDISKEKTIHKRLDRDKFKNMILRKYFGLSKNNSILREVKVVEQFQDIDSVSNKPVYFDAYLKEENNEIFINIRKGKLPSIMFHDTLYVQLNKILAYQKIKNNNTQLLLLIAREKESNNDRYDYNIERFFEPAKKIGLLNLVYVEYDKTEYESCLIEI